MLFAVIFITAAYIPSHIKAWLKHPMLASVKTWALAHLLSNGDLGSIVLFGAFLAWGVYARIAAKRRGDLGFTTPPAGWTNDMIVVVLGVVIYFAAWLTTSTLTSSACGCSGRSAGMSAQSEVRRLTAPDIRARKGGEPIVCLTSYHAHTAAIADKHCDVILVGDSLGMVMHGLETTVPVTLDMMILQGHAVMRGSKRALVVVDMPFGSYEASKEQAFMNCRARAQGDRLRRHQGGRRHAHGGDHRFLSERGVPVMAHVGLTPQSINMIGSFRAQGREEADWARIEEDALAVAKAGAFSMVIEAVAEPLARKITGCGADPDHRHRRKRGLRRPGAGDGGHARPVPARAEIRQALRRPRPRHRQGDRRLCRRGARAHLSGPRARLPDEGEKALNP